MEIRYEAEIDALDEWEMTHPLSATAYKVMRKLQYLASKEKFPVQIRVTNTMLSALVGCSEPSLIKAREQLAQAGLIACSGGTRKANQYTIFYFSAKGKQDEQRKVEDVEASDEAQARAEDAHAPCEALPESETKGLKILSQTETTAAANEFPENKTNGLKNLSHLETHASKECEFPDYETDDLKNLSQEEEDALFNNIYTPLDGDGREYKNKGDIGIGGMGGREEGESAIEYLGRCGIRLGRAQYEAIREFYESGISEEMLRMAADEAVEYNAASFAYIRKVINNWICAGIKTPEEARAMKAKRRSEQSAAKQERNASFAQERPAQKMQFFTDRWRKA